MDLPINQICFSQDTKQRKGFFRVASFAHPAKMSLGLQIYLIEHYTKEGDTILDPMAGSGTLLVACALGRNVVLIELESKFCDMMRQNWEKIKSQGAMLGYRMGDCKILCGDARNLPELLADKMIFSPPYANPRDVEPDQEKEYENKRLGANDKSHGRTAFRGHYKADAVICSPPYEAQGFKCDENPANVMKREAKRRVKYPMRPKVIAGRYGDTTDNIGNLKSNNYLQAMAQVYLGCYRILKDEGIMCLVTKNFIRNKQIVRLDLDTIKLCEQAGFTLKERLKRKLTQQSFWRTIYYKKYPDAPKIDSEDILVFEKTMFEANR